MPEWVDSIPGVYTYEYIHQTAYLHIWHATVLSHTSKRDSGISSKIASDPGSAPAFTGTEDFSGVTTSEQLSSLKSGM